MDYFMKFIFNNNNLEEYEYLLFVLLSRIICVILICERGMEKMFNWRLNEFICKEGFLFFRESIKVEECKKGIF